MIQITSAQLEQAAHAAREVQRLETANDAVTDHIYRHSVDVPKSAKDPMGCAVFEIEVPKALIREQIAARIAAAHKVLRDCGIELVG